MKKLLFIMVFLAMSAGVCLADYDYYLKRDPQTCAEAKEWGNELITESRRLSNKKIELIKQKNKKGDNTLDFYEEQTLNNQQSMWNDEHRAWKEALERLCPVKK